MFGFFHLFCIVEDLHNLNIQIFPCIGMYKQHQTQILNHLLIECALECVVWRTINFLWTPKITFSQKTTRKYSGSKLEWYPHGPKNSTLIIIHHHDNLVKQRWDGAGKSKQDPDEAEMISSKTRQTQWRRPWEENWWWWWRKLDIIPSAQHWDNHLHAWRSPPIADKCKLNLKSGQMSLEHCHCHRPW